MELMKLEDFENIYCLALTFSTTLYSAYSVPLTPWNSLSTVWYLYFALSIQADSLVFKPQYTCNPFYANFQCRSSVQTQDVNKIYQVLQQPYQQKIVGPLVAREILQNNPLPLSNKLFPKRCVAPSWFREDNFMYSINLVGKIKKWVEDFLS